MMVGQFSDGGLTSKKTMYIFIMMVGQISNGGLAHEKTIECICFDIGLVSLSEFGVSDKII